MNFGTVVVIAGVTGLLSFGFLAVAIGSDYWYIIEVNAPNNTNSEELNSHSGLWRIYEGKNGSSHFIPSILAETANYTDQERNLLDMHRVIVILLPLSLVLLVCGWVFGLVSSLARSPTLLSGTSSYFLICSILTLSGVSLYISYSQKALEEIENQFGALLLAQVHVSFGWSLAVAWLSFSLEVSTGLLLLLAARMILLEARLEASSVADSPI
ncbi:transmembrane protein 235-like [Paramormyrops kingsleyae]|uniref:Transmembrane protein 235 n=1 Tax=Paramormyrops kingsleyae TaxID=1676925 RepID=A0A3B3SB89_9TELE|nr:transmembrane protein 235-like [Paramormyrops kingsleyae]